MGGEAFKRRLVHNVAVAEVKSWFKTKFKCVYVAMRSLVMSLFLHDLLVNYIRYLQCLNLTYMSHSTWFLDGRTSILVLCFAAINSVHFLSLFVCFMAPLFTYI